MSEAQVNFLTKGGDATFPEAERAAVAYAEELTRNPEAVSKSTYENLRAHWNERQIVEITAVTGLFNYFNRFNNALQMEPTVYPTPLGDG